MRRIWVDTDVALGARRGDVDDGFALAAVARAHQRAEVELIGVSAVAGNTDAATAKEMAGRLLQVAGIGWRRPVLSGESAARALTSLAEGDSVLALGPLSHVAHALRLDPSLADRVDLRLVATVSDRRRHPLLGRYCLNSRKDREAARAVMQVPFRKRHVFPLDVVAQLRADRHFLAAIERRGALGEYLARESKRWLRQAPLRYFSSSFPLWDLVAALEAIGWLVDPRFRESRLVGFEAEASRSLFVERLE